MAKLIITRARQYADMLRAYAILVDGVRHALIRRGETIVIKVAPGYHQVAAVIDWCRSNPIELEAASGGLYVLEVGSNVSKCRLFLAWTYITTWSDRYLYLREADPDTAIGFE